MLSVSVVVVTFNSARHIGACLASLRDHGPICPYEVVVVDNASSDATVDIVRRDWPAARLILHEANVGFAAAANRGIRETASDLVLLLNPDAAVTPGAVTTLIHELDANPDVAIAGPRIEDDRGRAELSFGRNIGLGTETVQRLRVRGHEHAWPFVEAWVERAVRAPSSPDWVSGACWLARRAVLEAAGLFDERFFLYTEDVDLCARVRSRGHRVAFVPSAVIRHARGASRRALPDHAVGHYRRSQVAFYEKHHPRSAWLLKAYLKLKGALPDTTTQQR
jgi:GT2 family glycosyltransferase